MSLDDSNPVWLALRLVIVVSGLFLLGFGTRIAVSQRFPPAWIRVTRLPGRDQWQPVRIGGGMALVGASLALQQVPFLIDMPFPVQGVMFAVALLLATAAVAWHVLLRR